MQKAALKVSNHRIALHTHVLFLLILSTTIVSVFILLGLSVFFPKPVPIDPNLLVDIHRILISPKPIERFIFLSLATIIPLYTLYLTSHQQGFAKINYPTFVSVALPFFAALILIIPLFNSDYLVFIGGIKLFSVHPDSMFLVYLVLATMICLGWVYFKPVASPRIRRNLTWALLICSTLFLILAWRIAGINSAGQDPSWSEHVDAAIYATSQVIAGKTLLVDLPSQYGLFPEIIAPLFQIIKPTILNFSLLFAFMQFVSLIGLFFVLSKSVQHSFLMWLAGLCLLVLTFQTMTYFSGSADRYYQYWPIRFFWPAISVVGFYHFSRNNTWLNSLIVSFVGAIGALWIVDTGLFIILAFAAYLTTKSIVLHLSFKKSESKQYLTLLGLHILVTLVVIAAFLGALWLKAQQPLKLSWLFEYQKIFYGLGFAMLPLPRQIHPWMSVLAVYLLGLISALMTWYRKSAALRADLVFYLSALGLGMFVYYEGRSHVFILISVSWPALMIITIAADSILSRIRNRTLPFSEIWYPIAAVAFLIAGSVNFISQIPKMMGDLKYIIATRNSVYTPFIISELALIKKHTQLKQECLIVARRQGIYYVESHLASPIKGPGIIETILQSDKDKFLSQLFKGTIDCVFLGIGDYSTPKYPIDFKRLGEKYQLSDINSEHTMVYLTPKPGLSQDNK